MKSLLEELRECGSWYDALKDYHTLLEEIDVKLLERELDNEVLPVRGQRLKALSLTPLENVKALVVAQDPYPGKDGVRPHAMGLAFSVHKEIKVPASLKNIYKELAESEGVATSHHGDLRKWAMQGVLLWNVLLSLDAGESMSHKKLGWKTFTEGVIKVVASQAEPMVFLSFGRQSHAFSYLFEESEHLVVKTSHPSPLGARKSSKDGSFVAFIGSGCFGKANSFLKKNNRTEIDWSLDD
jgi:uracil-DNA glycosylase